MKKLLAFLILLMVGMALFAMPVIGVTDTVSANTVERVQFVGRLETVTDISPVVQAENSPVDKINIQVSTVNDHLFTATSTVICLYRQEAYPLYGYSKTETSAANRYIRLAIEGLP